MRTTRLGGNGPEVGVIGLGCMGMTFSYDMETPRDEATSRLRHPPPLGRGFLTGRFASSDDLPRDDFRRGLPRFQQNALRANPAIVERVREVARRAGATPAQVALAWVLAQGPHLVPIPGTKTPRYLADNAGAADIGLSAAVLAELDELPPPQGARY